MNNLQKPMKLNNGIEIPRIGFGTFKIEDGNTVIDTVKIALDSGYRLIDTASIYGNEKGVGRAIEQSNIPREDIFLTSKIWNTDQGYESTFEAFEESLEKLKTDYLDLYLIHWPKPLSTETWNAMEKLYANGKIRAIGISNFMIHHIEPLLKECEIVPMVNQVELHPQFPQEKLRDFCKEHSIIIKSWGPLMQGRVFEVELMKELSQKYNKSIAQVTLRWHLQLGVISLPKSTKPERIKSNIGIFDFEISDEDMKRIETLKGDRIGIHPDKIDF
jgi:diketogulonate reductase-like aldo/keto reductase